MPAQSNNTLYEDLLKVTSICILVFLTEDVSKRDFPTKIKILPNVPDPDPPDSRVFWPPGSGSTSQRYGSGPDPDPSIIMQI